MILKFLKENKQMKQTKPQTHINTSFLNELKESKQAKTNFFFKSKTEMTASAQENEHFLNMDYTKQSAHFRHTLPLKQTNSHLPGRTDRSRIPGGGSWPCRG